MITTSADESTMHSRKDLQAPTEQACHYVGKDPTFFEWIADDGSSSFGCQEFLEANNITET